MVYAPSWWYVADPERSIVFDALVVLLDVPLMPILFFISGYFALPTLTKRRSAKEFLKNKFKRVGFPWIFGSVILAPPITYMIYLSRSIPMSFVQFWSRDFWNPIIYQQSVYWFLGILFLMFSLLSLAYKLSKNIRMLQQKVAIPSSRVFVAFIVLVTVAFFFISLFYTPTDWRHCYIFVFQPVRVPWYIGYFILGMYAYQNAWFTSNGYKPNLSSFFISFTLSGMCYLASRFIIPAENKTLLMKSIEAVTFNVFCFFSVMFALTFFKQKINKQGQYWKSLAAAAYGIYYFHSLFLYPLALIFRQMPLIAFQKATIVILLAILLSWLLTVLLQHASFQR
jgi:surface polysaccharide O-acyltransferase-like enzyme